MNPNQESSLLTLGLFKRAGSSNQFFRKRRIITIVSLTPPSLGKISLGNFELRSVSQSVRCFGTGAERRQSRSVPAHGDVKDGQLVLKVREEHASLSLLLFVGETRSDVSRREQPVSKSSAAFDCLPKKKSNRHT